MKKIIIFDIDGTLFNTKAGIVKAFNETLCSLSLNPLKKGEDTVIIGPPIKESFIKLRNMSEADANQAAILYRKLYIEKYIQESVPYEGIFECIDSLKSIGFYVCIATLKTKEQVDRLLNLFSMTMLFDSIQCADVLGNYSKSEMLMNIHEKFIVNGNDFFEVFVGDTWNDYLAAKQVNVEFIYAKYGYGNGLFVNECKCITSIKKLLDLLKF